MKQDEHGRFVKGERVIDREFVRIVHTLPCCAREMPMHACRGPIQAHHAGSYVRGDNPHGKGKRADDDTCISLCEGAHVDLEDAVGSISGRGTFAGLTGEQRRALEQKWIEITRHRVLARRNGARGPMSEAELPW